MNVRWIALTPFGYQRSPGDTTIRTTYDRQGGETDSAMARDVAVVHRLGMNVMLKPHIWINHSSWPGDIKYENEEDWNAWFTAYGEMMLHYVALARDSKIGVLCIGNELKGTSAGQPERWRELIRQIRGIYHGQLIYAANWDEYQHVLWWDDLDAIGINAYFPLTQKDDPTLEDLRTGARSILAKIEPFQRQWGKHIIFTEIGFESVADAARRPWTNERTGPPDPALQQRCYQAVLETFWEAPWLRGMYWWKYFSSSAADKTGTDRDPFSPRNKPAAQTLAQWYAKLHP